MSHLQGRGHCQSCGIRHLSIFADLGTAQLGSISAFHPSVMRYESGEVIYHQQTPSNNAFTLRQGLVKLLKVLPNGRSHIVRVLRRGDLFGFDGFAGENYNHTAVPMTGVEVCRLPLAELLDLKKQLPEIEQSMMIRWIVHLREAEDMMVELGAKKAGERLASFLIRWSSNVDDQQDAGWVEMPLSRAEIGELLGLTVETVSRFMSEWKRQGFLQEQRGSIRMQQVDELRRLVCASGSC
ncbi:MAG TPA: Crp/Fnr family transcriptional regulator [Thiolinea sp.]|nr:Crp/Fnr family transcriptional regulator [Thiolinea sp.]